MTSESETLTEADPDLTAFDLLRRRARGTYEIDEWGLDPELVRLVDPLVDLRFAIEVDGAPHVPPVGPAVLVHNRRFGLTEATVLMRGVRAETGRFVRVTGVPDGLVVGPILRRFGGALGRPDEVAGLLRADQLVAIAAAATVRRARAGAVSPDDMVPAAEMGVPVLPVAVVGREVGRNWRILIGEPLPTPVANGPLAAAELADEARAAIQELIDDAIPPRWFLG